MATYNSDSDLFLLCDRLDSWIRFRLLTLLLALGFGLSSRLRIHLLDSVSRIRSLGFVFCSLSLGFGLFPSVSTSGFGLGSRLRIRLLSSVSCLRSLGFGLFFSFHSVSAPEFGFDSWIRF